MSPTASADPIQLFVAAVRANDVESAASALRQYPQLRPRLDDALPGFDFDGTALIAAVNRRSRAMIDLLLDAGANIDQKSHWWAGGFGVLDHADPELVPHLLQRGATMTINAAARLGRLEDVERLIDEDPNAVRARGGDGQTPLHVASTVDVARLLLARGADIDALDVDHESTPAQYLVRDHQDVVRLLLQEGCRSDILMAAAVGDLSRVKQWVERDPASVEIDVSERHFPMRDPRAGGSIYIWTLGVNKTAHVVAREFGHEDVFRYLMAHTPESFTLALACELGDRATFEKLLALRPNIAETLSDDERRKLANAAESGNLDAVRLMLEAGWPVDAPGRVGATALHWAAYTGNVAMVRELLAHDAPVDAREPRYNGTPLGWALHGSRFISSEAGRDYPGVVAALLDAGAVISSPADVEASDPVRELLRRRGVALGDIGA
jgi:ankyrin repeat protein